MFFMKDLFLLATFCNCFFVSMATIMRQANSFIKIKQLINPDYPCKNGVKQLKRLLKKNYCKCVSFTLLIWTQNLATPSKCNKKYFFGFTTICLYTWLDLFCLTCLAFLKSLCWPLWIFAFKNPSKDIKLCVNYNLCVIKRKALFNENICGSFCEWMSVIKHFRVLPKLSKILAMIKHYNKMSVLKHFFRKSSFPFNFLLAILTNFNVQKAHA